MSEGDTQTPELVLAQVVTQHFPMVDDMPDTVDVEIDMIATMPSRCFVDGEEQFGAVNPQVMPRSPTDAAEVGVFVLRYQTTDGTPYVSPVVGTCTMRFHQPRFRGS